MLWSFLERKQCNSDRENVHIDSYLIVISSAHIFHLCLKLQLLCLLWWGLAPLSTIFQLLCPLFWPQPLFALSPLYYFQEIGLIIGINCVFVEATSTIYMYGNVEYINGSGKHCFYYSPSGTVSKFPFIWSLQMHNMYVLMSQLTARTLWLCWHHSEC